MGFLFFFFFLGGWVSDDEHRLADSSPPKKSNTFSLKKVFSKTEDAVLPGIVIFLIYI